MANGRLRMERLPIHQQFVLAIRVRACVVLCHNTPTNEVGRCLLISLWPRCMCMCQKGRGEARAARCQPLTQRSDKHGSINTRTCVHVRATVNALSGRGREHVALSISVTKQNRPTMFRPGRVGWWWWWWEEEGRGVGCKVLCWLLRTHIRTITRRTHTHLNIRPYKLT